MSPGSANRGAKKKTAAAKSKPASKPKPKSGKKWRRWLQWRPVIIGIALIPVAVRAVDYLALTGRWQAWLVAPWSFLLQGNPLHLSPAGADYLAEVVMDLQFPVYGLIYMLLTRRFRPGTALGFILAIHLLAFAAQSLVATS
jgi:ABC-type phosphate/phosphonate transport system permease subunit